MKYVLNKIQHIDLVTSKVPTCKTRGKSLGPIDEIGLKKKEPRISSPTPKAPSQDKLVRQIH